MAISLDCLSRKIEDILKQKGPLEISEITVELAQLGIEVAEEYVEGVIDILLRCRKVMYHYCRYELVQE